jgi:4'-phosphopantetheinyl transferase
MLALPVAVDGLYVLAVKTPASPLRDNARSMIRAALRDKLMALLAVAAGNITLLSTPGEPIRLAPPWERIGVSVSHEAGLSLAAINLHGAVGIDLLRLGEPLADMPALARDYLGPAAAAKLGTLPVSERPAAFAQDWTGLEARLKCLGQALSEWTPELEVQLAACTVTNLAMPTGWVAAVATPGKRL